MRIAILHQHVPDDALPDERDVLMEAETVRGALGRLGYEAVVIACHLDLNDLAARLDRFAPDLAFNMVESFAGTGRLQHVVPGFLETLGVPYSGNSAEAQLCTSSKLLAKRLMAGAGIPVPADHLSARGPCIVKPIWEDASIGIDDASVVSSGAIAAEILATKGRDWFAEAYLPGREINVALLDGEVLPIAEVCFDGDWSAKPKIVGYAAKWDATSFEYQHTVRTFDVGDALDAEAIRRIARQCWELFDLAGWARVDLRVGEEGPVVLEVNANPCLSPDAGFAASLEVAQVTYDQAIDRIVQAGLRRWR